MSIAGSTAGALAGWWQPSPSSAALQLNAGGCERRMAWSDSTKKSHAVPELPGCSQRCFAAQARLSSPGVFAGRGIALPADVAFQPEP